MTTKYQFGGLGNLFKCSCGCSDFFREIVREPEHKVLYTCFNCQQSYTANTPPNKSVHADAGDSATSSDIVHASAESTSQSEAAPTQRG